MESDINAKDISKVINDILLDRKYLDNINLIKNMLDILFDIKNIYVYISEIETNNVIYSNKSLREAFNIDEEKFNANNIFDQKREDKLLENYNGEAIECEIYESKTDRYFQSISKLIIFNERKYKFEIIREITEQKKVDQYLLFKLDFEYCLKHILELFVGVYDFEDAVTLALKEIGLLVRCDSAYVLLYNDENKEVTYKYEWVDKNRNIKPKKNSTVKVSDITWWEDGVEKEQLIFHNKNKDVNDESMVKSLIGAPLILGEKFMGVVCIDGISYGDWFDFAFDGIKIFSEIIANSYEKHLFEQELRRKSFLDGLTNINNRSYFELKMKELSNVSPVGILICDLDGLKLINDNLGHSFGDEVLRSVSNILKNNIGYNDILCRIGGDEFAIILPHKNINYLKDVYENIKRNIETYVKVNSYFPISLSIGYSIKEYPDESIMDTFKMADNLMYSEKYKFRKEKLRNINKYIEINWKKNCIN
ncbi:diguanylate cyclase (GGDEF) domain-containing protein [Clostridium cavendishii DSM 21758]|uniref:Diguanylate cyclase (GGDEF) domain-containing protein n=1 Tax=Clostridium cavendishii DSM 21758 TaxID=1121302 RepID=A0A1M6SS63_9CLOT|nr:sensor domain-containing diguanylate cyclase [Clostridium cavendishii]SHK47562.1 diguanylate cyclase (GGDEF) domain-containing protein [Clostridium cavendishii DSM 21758]